MTRGEKRRVTRGEALQAARRRLAAAGVESSALDARILLQHALAVQAIDLVRAPEADIAETDVEKLDAFIRRRLAGEPTARILGEKEFFGLPFRLTPATLAPRPETELIVEEALRLFPRREDRFAMLDLGTGSGAILLSILHERPNAAGVGIDRSIGAARAARDNAAALGLADRATFVVGDWAAAIGGRFDFVAANPPYVAAGDIAGLAPEVAVHDPRLALDGGPDGLDAYRAILPDLSRLLAPGGRAALEIGAGQGADLSAIAAANGLKIDRILRDLAGLERTAVIAPDHATV